jgi:hypothetical protein
VPICQSRSNVVSTASRAARSSGVGGSEAGGSAARRAARMCSNEAFVEAWELVRVEEFWAQSGARRAYAMRLRDEWGSVLCSGSPCGRAGRSRCSPGRCRLAVVSFWPSFVSLSSPPFPPPLPAPPLTPPPLTSPPLTLPPRYLLQPTCSAGLTQNR